MKITIIDGSIYFKGLLLLIRRDRNITEPEIALIKRIGKSLGFEREFCENTIDHILENKYIIDELPVFSTKELAEKFIKDGLLISFSDNESHPLEEEWLESVAEKNGLDFAWFDREKTEASKRKAVPMLMEADGLTVY
jgi:hypothetical protein